MSSVALSAYKQTTDHTCADSSFMVAAHELIGSPMNRTRELDLWRRNTPWIIRPLLARYVGTPPGLLARYIQRNEPRLSCEIIFYVKNVAPMVPQRRRLVGPLSAFQDWFTKVFLGLNPPARQVKRLQTPDDVFELLDQDPATRLLQVIVIEERLVHFVVVRFDEQGRIAVMDPRKGENFFMDRDGFTRSYGPVLYGYCTVVRLRSDTVGR